MVCFRNNANVIFTVVESKKAVTSISVIIYFFFLDAPEAVTLEIVGRDEEIETEIGIRFIQELIILAASYIRFCSDLFILDCMVKSD